MELSPEEAARLGRDALIWLAGRPEDLAALLAVSGLAPQALRPRAADPEFLGFVLDFLLADEARARAFAEDYCLPPGAAQRARAALPGGDAPEWT